MEILQNFGINGLALVEYAVNFFILLAILTVFAYKPFIKMLEKRRAMIADSVKNAQDITRQKESMQKEYKKILHDANNESKKIIENAMKQSQVVAEHIQSDAKAEAEKILSQAKDEIALEKAQMYTSLKGELALIVATALGKVLKDSLSENEQQKILDKTVQEIHA